MSQEIKVYYVEDIYTKDEVISMGHNYDDNPDNDAFDDFVPVVYQSDYDKLEARCKELQEQNSILKAKLEKCKDGQVNMYHAEWSGGDADTEKFRAELELELDSIGGENG